MGNLTIQGRLAEAFTDRITGGVMSLKWAGSNTIAAAMLSSLYPGLMLPRSLGFFARCAVGVMLLAILATLSRNASLSVAASVIAYAILSRRAIPTIGALLGIGIVFCMGLLVLDADVYDFIIASRVQSGENESFNGRAETWSAGWSAICRNWPCPVGFYGSGQTMGHTSHNLILTDMLELGVWGLGIHLMLFASIAGALFKARSRRRRAGNSANDLNILIGGLVCTFINMQFEDPQFTQPYIICHWIFMGICVAASRLPNDLNSHLASEAKMASVSDFRNKGRPPVAVKPRISVPSGKRLSW
jgi:O-antigen ligase